MIRILLSSTFVLLAVCTSKAQYGETFSTPNKGYLTNFVDDFTGVDWTMSTWDPQPPAAFGRDASDYFRTSGGVLAGIDFDQEVCWISPVLNTSGVGDTFYFSVKLTWLSFDSGAPGNNDYIDVKYSINGGGYTQVPNKVGGGTHTIEYSSGTGNDGSTTIIVSGLTGNSLQVQVCIKMDSDSEVVTIDNFGTQSIGVTLGCSKPVLNKTVTNATCGNGAVDLSVSGGTPGYTYAWSNGPTTQDISGLAAGTYTVTVTDNIGCTATTSATVGNAPLVLGTTVLNAGCASDANGAIDLSVSGGTSPYTYAWSNGPTTQDNNNLAPGTYTVTVTDNAGCTATTSATVGITPAGPYLETFSTPNKGYLTMMNNDFSGVNWTMTPWANGDRDANDYFRTNGGVLEGLDFDAEVCWVSPLLNISASGVVSISVDATWEDFDSGSPGDYIRLQYSVNGGAYTTVGNQFGGGSNGTVHYASGTGHDGNGTLTAGGISGNSLQIRICANFNTNDEEITLDNVSVPQNVTLACVTPKLSTSVTPVLCNGASTGAIDLTVTDGKPPYSYMWSNLPGAPDPEDQTGLAAGTYTVTVTDMAGVTATISATITQPATAITGSASASPACNTNDGAIQVTASGGTPGYQVKWSGPSSGDPAGVEIAASGGMYNITGLTVGAYTITITDANGCTATTSATVSTAGCCMVSANAGPNKFVCPGGSIGIGGAPTGSGTPTLSYAWAPAGTLNDATAANPMASPAGTTTYTVTVTSTAGCSATASVTITLFTPVAASTTTSNVLCNGASTGKITVNIPSGTSPYDISWDGPGANDGLANNQAPGYMIMNLPAGTYSITVSDDNSCTATTAATVTEPPALTLSATPTDVSCPGDANGKITLTIGGGTSPYDIYWVDQPNGNNPGNANNQSSGFMIPNLPAGNYFISVTDENNCSKTTTTTVGTANPTPVCSISDAMGVVCPNSSGNQYQAPAGMDGYSWSVSGNGMHSGPLDQQTLLVDAGASGTYTVSLTVTKNGCTSSCSKTVMIDMIPFSIVHTASYCTDDPGPVIGLNGSEMGASYRLQGIFGPIIIDSLLTGTGSNLVFGSFPNGNYQVVITGGTCDATINGVVNGAVADCPIALPDHCACDDPSGYTPVTVKVTAPPFQIWTVVDVVGLYEPSNPWPPITVGTPLTYMGGMYILDAARDNTKGYYVRVSNGSTEKDIQVGNPSW